MGHVLNHILKMPPLLGIHAIASFVQPVLQLDTPDIGALYLIPVTSL